MSNGRPKAVGAYAPGSVLMRGYLGTLFEGDDGSGGPVMIRVVETKGLEPSQISKMAASLAVLTGREDERLITLREVVEGDHFGVVSDHFVGDSMRTLLRQLSVRRKMVPIGVVLRLACDMLEAIDLLHDERSNYEVAAGRFSGGLTPDSFVVCDDGRTRLLEPGLELAFSQFEGWTRASKRLGYDAPELHDDGADIAANADVFTVAAVLWEALLNKRLLPGTSFEVVSRRWKTGSLPRADAAKRLGKEDTPKAVADLLASALSIDPGARPASAAEALRAFGDTGVEVASHDDVVEMVAGLAIRKPRSLRPPPGKAYPKRSGTMLGVGDKAAAPAAKEADAEEPAKNPVRHPGIKPPAQKTMLGLASPSSEALASDEEDVEEEERAPVASDVEEDVDEEEDVEEEEEEEEPAKAKIEPKPASRRRVPQIKRRKILPKPAGKKVPGRKVPLPPKRPAPPPRRKAQGLGALNVSDELSVSDLVSDRPPASDQVDTNKVPESSEEIPPPSTDADGIDVDVGDSEEDVSRDKKRRKTQKIGGLSERLLRGTSDKKKIGEVDEEESVLPNLDKDAPESAQAESLAAVADASPFAALDSADDVDADWEAPPVKPAAFPSLADEEEEEEEEEDDEYEYEDEEEEEEEEAAEEDEEEVLVAVDAGAALEKKPEKIPSKPPVAKAKPPKVEPVEAKHPETAGGGNRLLILGGLAIAAVLLIYIFVSGDSESDVNDTPATKTTTTAKATADPTPEPQPAPEPPQPEPASVDAGTDEPEPKVEPEPQPAPTPTPEPVAAKTTPRPRPVGNPRPRPTPTPKPKQPPKKDFVPDDI